MIKPTSYMTSFYFSITPQLHNVIQYRKQISKKKPFQIFWYARARVCVGVGVLDFWKNLILTNFRLTCSQLNFGKRILNSSIRKRLKYPSIREYFFLCKRITFGYARKTMVDPSKLTGYILGKIPIAFGSYCNAIAISLREC